MSVYIDLGLKEGPAKGLNTKWAEADVHEAAKMLKEIRMELLKIRNN